MPLFSEWLTVLDSFRCRMHDSSLFRGLASSLLSYNWCDA